MYTLHTLQPHFHLIKMDSLQLDIPTGTFTYFNLNIVEYYKRQCDWWYAGKHQYSSLLGAD